MREERYMNVTEASFRRRMEIHIAKNHDYANDNEALGNFKRVAQVLDALGIVPSCTPDTVALIYSILKIDRYCNLRLKQKSPKNESVQDTIDDLKNYLDLLEACYIDEKDSQDEQETRE